MAESVGNIIDTSKLLLKGRYVEHLCKDVDTTEQYLEKFYKRMKYKIQSCRSELKECESKLVLSSETRKNIKCLNFDLSASESEAEKEAILKNIQSELSQIKNLPILETNKVFEDFLKNDCCPIRLSYSSTEDVEYQRVFDQTETDLRQKGSNEESENNLVSEQKERSNDLYYEISDNSLHTYTHQNQDEKKTSNPSKMPRAAALHDLTSNSPHTLSLTNEKIFSFRELKDHISDGKPLSQPSKSPKPESDFEDLQLDDLDLPTCADVKIFETYIITTTYENIIKLDRKTNTTLGKLSFQSLGQMCIIRGSYCIGVIQTNFYITIISTNQELKPIYRIKTSKAYTNICHVETYNTTPKYQPDPSYTFGLVYTDTSSGGFAERVEFVKAATTTSTAYQRIPQYDAQVEVVDIRPSSLSGISGIGAVWTEKTLKIILGGVSKIICFEKNNSQIKTKWEIAIRKAATDVVCVKSKVYVCVQDEGRIMLIDINGNIDNENVLEGVLQCKPHKLSVTGNAMLIKSFEESRWKNIVFSKQSSND